MDEEEQDDDGGGGPVAGTRSVGGVLAKPDEHTEGGDQERQGHVDQEVEVDLAESG